MGNSLCWEENDKVGLLLKIFSRWVFEVGFQGGFSRRVFEVSFQGGFSRWVFEVSFWGGFSRKVSQQLTWLFPRPADSLDCWVCLRTAHMSVADEDTHGIHDVADKYRYKYKYKYSLWVCHRWILDIEDKYRSMYPNKYKYTSNYYDICSRSGHPRTLS